MIDLHIGFIIGIRVTWITIITTGFIIALYLFINAWLDLRYLRQDKHNGRRQIIARNNLVTESIRLATFSLYLLISLIVVVTPLPIDGTLTFLGVVSSLAFVLSALLMVAGAYVERYYRQQAIQYRIIKPRDRLGDKPP